MEKLCYKRKQQEKLQGCGQYSDRMEKAGKSGNKMECAGYVLPDISGNMRKSAVLSTEYGLWRKWQEEKGKEGDGNEETRCKNRKTIDVMSV